MLKRAVSILICAIFVISLMPMMCTDNDVFASECEFGDRILYGGISVDVGNDTVYSDNGILRRVTANGGDEIIADVDAKYLNYYDGKLWFTSGNNITSCSPDGSGMSLVCAFEQEIKCLYVTDDGMMYLSGETVYTRNKSGKEKAVLTRNDIEGFVPNPDGSIRWIKKNPNFEHEEAIGNDFHSGGNDEFLQYVSAQNSEPETDITAPPQDYGTELAADTNEYSGPYVEVGEVTLPLAEHMPGTFFTKNGKACTCHNTAANYCIQSVGNCNCMRYYPTGIKETCEIDLLGAQCFAFARMVFWKCFGFIDQPTYQSLYYNVGSLSSGAVTANSVKALLMKAAPGAHIRISAGHSFSILTMDEDFIVVYHGNAGGDGVASASCVVSTRRYTWEQFANSAARGIEYVNMPYNYPDSKVIQTKKEAGYYKLTSALNLRAETNTTSSSLAIIPNGKIIEVTEIDGFWGKTEYNGKTGWVFLEYTTFYSRKNILPSGNVFSLSEEGYLRAAEWKLSLDSFSERFDKQKITVKSADGKILSASDRVGTGSVVTIEIDGKIIDSATVCLAGDVNCNGALDVGDYLLIKRACLSNYVMSDIQSAAADVCENNGVDSLDYLMVRRYFFVPNAELFTAFSGE